MNPKKFDCIILGAGIYGLYAALFLAKRNINVAIIEIDEDCFGRASYINQARIHNGYHYPRSLETALNSAKYFKQFSEEFSFAVNNKFKQIYAISKENSLVTKQEFELFCKEVQIPLLEVNPKKYFNSKTVAGVYETEEYAFDGLKIKEYFLEEISKCKNITFYFNHFLNKVEKDENYYHLFFDDKILSSKKILNATYASSNQIIKKFCQEKFKIKYEICEMILCETNDKIKDIGITVMDGAFFSIMPFGLTNLHSLASVTFTPHKSSYDLLPVFDCQDSNVSCSKFQLLNCNNCPNKPKTAWEQMHNLAYKFLKPNIEIKYKNSLFAIKPILLSSELDDSRPTVIKIMNQTPTFISILSGKINTIYNLDDILEKYF